MGRNSSLLEIPWTDQIRNKNVYTAGRMKQNRSGKQLEKGGKSG